jgi:hypothetical protein
MGALFPRQTDRLTVGRNIRLRLSAESSIVWSATTQRLTKAQQTEARPCIHCRYNNKYMVVSSSIDSLTASYRKTLAFVSSFLPRLQDAYTWHDSGPQFQPLIFLGLKYFLSLSYYI